MTSKSKKVLYQSISHAKLESKTDPVLSQLLQDYALSLFMTEPVV